MSSPLFFLSLCYKWYAFVDCTLEAGALSSCMHTQKSKSHYVLISFSTAFLYQCCLNLGLVLLVINESVYLFKICIKSKANLEFILNVKNYLGFSCSLRCIVTAGYNHRYRPCLFLQEIYLILCFMLFILSLMPSVNEALCLSAFCFILVGHRGWG